MKEVVLFGKHDLKYKNLLELKLKIQDLEDDLDYFRKEWQKMGEVVRSYAQARSQLIQELLDQIK